MHRCDFGAVRRITGWAARPQAVPVLFAGFAALLLMRNPDALLHAEFWAEDGWIWYPDAYASGLRAFVVPVAGYLQTLPRLVAWLVQPFPLAWAPTLFALAALLVQALPPLFLVSSRMADAWPDARGRLLFALLWLALPNTSEVYVNLTNGQWHLATLAFLVLLSRPSRRRAVRGLDGAVLLLSGVSGPFCVVLAPVAAWLACTRRDRTSLWRAAAVFAAAAVQGACVLATIGDRSPAVLGAGPRMLARIVSQQVVLGAILGQGNMPVLTAMDAWATDLLPLLAAAAAMLLAGAAVLRGSQALRLAALSATLLLAAALSHPQITADGPQWPPMQLPGIGQRYYYIPMLAWLAVLFSLAGSAVRWRRMAGTMLLGCMAVGLWSDWRIPPRAPTGFAAQARAFEAAPPGTRMGFRFHPLFDKFPMYLTRR